MHSICTDNHSVPTHPFLSLSTEIKFSVLNNTDIDEAVECLAESFSEAEPMTHALNISVTEFSIFARYLCEKAINNSLSLVARDKTNNKLIGCRISEPLITKDDELPELSAKFFPIFALLKAVSAPLPIIPYPKKVAHFVTLAVNKHYQGRGLAKQLLALQLHFLKRLGYDYFSAEFTSPRSYQAIKSILSSEIEYTHVIEYKNFIYNGHYPFANLTGQAIGCLSKIDLLKPDLAEWVNKQQINL
ncbi:GNAT family N-acetyltransferase [Legionella sp. D16C41]|uniref:GNAT family N-acetyltransferase n=1 Tax=Legionella sp. D16C41 TaxID=3402688 RepID=UPI003AF89CDA